MQAQPTGAATPILTGVADLSSPTGPSDARQAGPPPVRAAVPVPRGESPTWLPGPPPPEPGGVPGTPGGDWDPPLWVRRSRASRRPRTAVVVLSVLLGLALVAGGGTTWYLLRVNSAWQQHSQQWQDRAQQQATDLAQARSDLESTRTELAAVQDQLQNAQNRITQLADEKAQLGDQSAAQQQLADYQARVSKAAGQVATALTHCIDGQQALISYIENSSLYDPASLASYRANVENYCGSARDANTALQAELSQ